MSEISLKCDSWRIQRARPIISFKISGGMKAPYPSSLGAITHFKPSLLSNDKFLVEF